MMAQNTHRWLAINNGYTGKAVEGLSSGQRINRAGDDAAGLAISEKMRGQIRGLNQASRNAQDGISMIQTAEGGLNETHAMLQRMREMVVQANNDTNTPDDLAEIQKEIVELNKEITRIASKTEFNTKTLLDGSLGVQADDGTFTIAALTAAGISVDVSGVESGETLTFTVVADTSITVAGTNSGISQTIAVADTGAIGAGTVMNFDALGFSLKFSADTDIDALGITGDTITTTGTQIKFQIGANQSTVMNISIADMKATALGSGVAGAGTATSINAINVTAAGEGFDINIQVIDKAISQVSAQRSQLGAWQNRLEYTIKNLDTSSENLQAAESRIRDLDMAKGMMTYTKLNILTQAGTAMLAQANQAPQNVLQLLR